MLNKLRKELRVKSDVFDDEIEDLIAAAKADLRIAGVNIDKTVTETYTPEPTEENPEPEPVDVEVMDPLIKRAIILYGKANFGWNNSDAERFQGAYVMLKQHLSLSEDYAEVTEDAI